MLESRLRSELDHILFLNYGCVFLTDSGEQAVPIYTYGGNGLKDYSDEEKKAFTTIKVSTPKCKYPLISLQASDTQMYAGCVRLCSHTPVSYY